MFRRVKFNYDRVIYIDLGDTPMKPIHEDHLFLNAFKYAAIGMAIVSTEGQWLKVNPSLCRILGYSMQEFEQMTFQDVTHPDDLESDLQSVNKLLQGDELFYETEKRYLHKTGDIVWGHLSVSLVKNDKDQPSYFISQIQDITEQKKLSVKLADSEERYRKWIRNSPEPMAIHEDGTLLFINKEGVKLIGANSYHDLLGDQVLDYIHDDYKKIVSERIQYMVNTNQQPEPYDVKLVDLQRNVIDVRLSSVPLEYQGRKVIQVFFSNITQRKQIEEAIRKNEAQYKSLIQYNPDAVYGINLDGNFILVNETCTRITGYNEEEFLRMSFRSLIILEDLKKAEDAFKNTLEGKPQTLHLTIQKKNGNRVIINVTSVPIIFEEKIIGLYAVAKDITEQLQIEKELQKSNERFKAIFEKSGIGIVVLNRQGNALEVNTTYLDWFGKASEGLNTGQDEEQLFSQLLNGERDSYQVEKKYVRENSDIFYSDITMTILKNHEEAFALGMVHDITDRKRSEQLIKESEQRYRSVVELYPEGLFVHGEEKLKFINEKFMNLVGASSMEGVLQKPLIHYIHQDDRCKVSETINLLSEQKNPDPICTEVRCIRLDGSSFIGELSITKMKYDQECAILGIIRDVTKQKEAEQKLKEMNARLEEISKMDGLTAIPNRRNFDEVLQAEWKAASQTSIPLSLIMLDIDHFKAYNDTYGHHGGDECLKMIAQTLKKSIEYHKDFAARYGGEEFAIILPETDQENALIVAKRLHSMIEDLKIPHIGSKVCPYVTISLGVSTLIPTPQLQAQELIVQADRALYNSKATGRNRISVYAR